MKISVFSVGILLVLGGGTLLAGSGQRTGTNGASELLIPIGTRDIAMAGATVATTRGVEALFWNPAGSAWYTNTVTLYASHMSYIADIGVDCGAVSAGVEGFGVLSLQLKILSIGDIPVTTAQYPDGTGNLFRPQFFTMGLTYARQLTDRISVGFTTTLVNERMAEVSATGVAFNMGVIYGNLMGIQGLQFGAVVKNIGSEMAFGGPGLSLSAQSSDLQRGTMMYKIDAAGFELPSTFELGLAYGLALSDENNLLLASAFQNNNFSDDAYRFGAELGFKDLLFLRGGYDYEPPASGSRENIFGFTFGTGVHLLLGTLDVTFDYAYRTTKYFDGNHIVSMKVGL